MRHSLLILSSAFLVLVSSLAFAATLPKEAIPEKILTALYKTHPKAMDINAVKVSHFKQELYEVSFNEMSKVKEGEVETEVKTKGIELYRANGNLYVNGAIIDNGKTSIEMPAVTYDNLKAAFPKYDIKEAILVVNPNGAGEEYDLLINAPDGLWRVSIDRKGDIVFKEHE